jgi:tetratricopeptide (TPR) repeat protein
VKGIATEPGELISQIEADYKNQMKTQEPLSISMFTTSGDAGKSTTDINSQFVFSQLLIDCLLRLKPNEMNRRELISRCENEYKDNCIQFTNLREFREHYTSDKALWWYTRDSFFYKTLNAALRKQDIHMIFLYSSFIADLYHQLQHYQSRHPIRVYRSQLMSIDEIDYLESSIGQFISMSSFLSTSKHLQIADFYIGDKTQKTDLERVLFEIDADPKVVSTKPFADISSLSYFPEESEVLFMLGSIFYLKSINHDDNQVWRIRMSLCGDDEHNLKEALDDMKKQIGTGETNLRTLGKLLWTMGKFNLAEQYYNRLLQELSPNDPSLPSLYDELDLIRLVQGKHHKSEYANHKR